MIPNSREEFSDFNTLSKTKLLKHPTLHSGTYLHSLYIGVPPPLGGRGETFYSGSRGKGLPQVLFRRPCPCRPAWSFTTWTGVYLIDYYVKKNILLLALVLFLLHQWIVVTSKV